MTPTEATALQNVALGILCLMTFLVAKVAFAIHEKREREKA